MMVVADFSMNFGRFVVPCRDTETSGGAGLAKAQVCFLIYVNFEMPLEHSSGGDEQAAE